MDQVSIKRVQLLHPLLRTETLEILTLLNAQNIEIRIIEALRTFEHQDALYYQNKLPLDQLNVYRLKAHLPLFTHSRQQVWASNAKGGQSFHNYGLAFDFCLLHKDGSVSFDMKEDMDQDKKADWMEVVDLCVHKGWVWGHAFRDNDHFEKTFNHTWQQLLDLRKAGKIDKEGYVIL